MQQPFEQIPFGKGHRKYLERQIFQVCSFFIEIGIPLFMGIHIHFGYIFTAVLEKYKVYGFWSGYHFASC